VYNLVVKTIHKGNLKTSDLYIRDLKKLIHRLVNKIFYYIKRPGLLSHDIRYIFYSSKYHLQNYIDPPPPQGKEELTDDYFDRIDPKFGLRFYGTMTKLERNHFNLPNALQLVNETYKDEKSRKIMREFIIDVVGIEQKNKEGYQKYLIRSEILKNQD
jgi:hypothetical protein